VLTTLAAVAPGADGGAWVVVATAAVIFAVGRAGLLATLLDVRPLQFLGRISYSLYLVHFLGATAAKLGARVTGDSIPAALGWFLLANAISIVAAYVMYRLVEAPSLRLTKQPDPLAALRGLLRGRRPAEVSVAKAASGFAE
jgi:peptidoglycan/LPS O-acetylase OafA/YrhL